MCCDKLVEEQSVNYKKSKKRKPTCGGMNIREMVRRLVQLYPNNVAGGDATEETS